MHEETKAWMAAPLVKDKAGVCAAGRIDPDRFDKIVECALVMWEVRSQSSSDRGLSEVIAIMDNSPPNENETILFKTMLDHTVKQVKTLMPGWPAPPTIPEIEAALQTVGVVPMPTVVAEP